MAPDQGQQPKPTRLELEHRAAEFYRSIRKENPSEWKFIDDLAPHLAEFEHRVRAEEYDVAYQEVLKPIEKYLSFQGHASRLVEMHKKLVGHLKDRLDEATNQGDLGQAYRSLGKIFPDRDANDDGALQCLQKAIDIAQEIALSNDNSGEIQEALKEQETDKGPDKLSDRLREVHDQNSDQVKEAIKSVGIWSGHLGIVYAFMGNAKDSIFQLTKARNIANKIGDSRSEGLWLGSLSWAYLGQWQNDRNEEALNTGIDQLKQAMKIAKKENDTREIARHYASFGRIYHDKKMYQDAKVHHEKALDIARQIGDRFIEGGTLGNLGSTYHELGWIEQAIVYYQEALDIVREISDVRGQGLQLSRLGKAYQDMGDLLERSPEQFEQINNNYERAISYFKNARDLFPNVRDQQREAVQFDRLGNAFYSLGYIKRVKGEEEEARGEFKEAANSYTKGLDLKLGDPRGESYHWLGLGKAQLALAKKADDYANAYASFAKALQTQNVPEENELPAILGMGIARLRRGGEEEARQHFEDTKALLFKLFDERSKQIAEACKSPRFARQVRSALEMMRAADLTVPEDIDQVRSLDELKEASDKLEGKSAADWAVHIYNLLRDAEKNFLTLGYE